VVRNKKEERVKMERDERQLGRSWVVGKELDKDKEDR
jgi:hypothetical protein